MASPVTPDEKKYEEWRKNPDNWVLGIFYFNKEDKRLFPSKRSNLGWTINFANPASLIIMTILMFVSLGIIPLMLYFMSPK